MFVSGDVVNDDFAEAVAHPFRFKINVEILRLAFADYKLFLTYFLSLLKRKVRGLILCDRYFDLPIFQSAVFKWD